MDQDSNLLSIFESKTVLFGIALVLILVAVIFAILNANVLHRRRNGRVY